MGRGFKPRRRKSFILLLWLYWCCKRKCPPPRWKRRASAWSNRPPPQMALATAHPESATRAKETLSRPESPRRGLTQFPTLPLGLAPRDHLNAAAARLILALFRPIVPPPHRISSRDTVFEALGSANRELARMR